MSWQPPWGLALLKQERQGSCSLSACGPGLRGGAASPPETASAIPALPGAEYLLGQMLGDIGRADFLMLRMPTPWADIRMDSFLT